MFGKESCEFHFGNGYEVLGRRYECRWPWVVGAEVWSLAGKSGLEIQFQG